MGYTIDTCISPTQVKLAAEFPYSASVGCEAFELDKVGSDTASILSIVHFSLVCRAYSHRKDRKEYYMYGNSKHTYFSHISISNPY